MALFPPCLRRGFVAFVPALIAFCAAPAVAQKSGEKDGYRIIESIPAPQGESTDAYAEIMAKQRLTPDTTYATRIEGQLVTGRRLPSEEPDGPPDLSREPLFDMNGAGVAVAVLLLLAGLAAWMKFAGGGALLARAPTDAATKPQDAPDGWKMFAQETAASPADLLSRLAQMSDRGTALVLLLRHCLLAAGAATQIRFARSDTERRAFARLPREYIHGNRLSEILKTAELAHYGGRQVGEAEFSAMLDAGWSILAEAHRGAAHG